MSEIDIEWMRVAINAAETARTLNEVPIGACVVSAEGELLAIGFNQTIMLNDPTAHAEIVAVRTACAATANYRLTNTTVYSTIEPCAMCAGALVNARVGRLVYGATDERFGGVDTHFGIGKGAELNHRITIGSSVLVEECRSLIQDFFRSRRK